MSYLKTFLAGAKLLASQLTENFTLLEPTSAYQAKQPASLACGASGLLSAFQAVTNGSFKITIDGLELEVYKKPNTSAYITLLYSDSGDWNTGVTLSATTQRLAQAFLTGANTYQVSKLKIQTVLNNSNPVCSVSFYLADVNGLPTGDAINTQSLGTFTGNGQVSKEIVLTPFSVLPSTKYVAVISKTGGGSGVFTRNYYNSETTKGAVSTDSGVNWTQSTVMFQWGIYGYNEESALNFSASADVAGVANIIQAEIRRKTGRNELVAFDTNHFVLTSSIGGEESEIGYLESLGLGTDISGTSFLNGRSGVGVITDGINGSYSKVLKTNALTGKLDTTLVTTHWDYLSTQAISASGTGTTISQALTMPANANFAVIKFLASGGQPQMEGELIIARNGVVSATRRDGALYSGSNYRYVSASLSGNTITLTHGYVVSTALVLSGAAYYYT